MTGFIKNRVLSLTLALFLFGSCEKIIDLKLDNSDPLVVIDGGLNDQNENQELRISKTYNFTESNKFNGVSGAVVILTRPNGSKVNYNEVSPGIYRTVKMRGVPGNKYILSVTIEGKTYTASSIMPVRVNLDSLSFKQFNIFSSQSTYVAVNFSDPPNIANQYRYILKTNGNVKADMVNEDRFNNGNKVSDAIFYELDDLSSGETIDVEFQCIDKQVYRYFYSLGQNSGAGGPPVAPANPPSNFDNGALGVFNAYTTSKLSIVIK